MMKTGLVSVTFRKLSPQRVVSLAAQAGLDGVEWGGDVHVPHGDLAAAKDVRDMTVGAGLAVASYGSYYRVCKSADEGLSFETALATARALGAPVIRVWGGVRGSAEASPEYRAKIVCELQHMADLARDQGVTVALEFHCNTLTDTAASALQLLRDVGCPDVRTYWQPPVGRAPEDCCADIRLLSEYLANLHVHYFDPASRARRPLADGVAVWRRYLALASSAAPARNYYALLEFVRDDATGQFLDDAKILRELRDSCCVDFNMT